LANGHESDYGDYEEPDEAGLYSFEQEGSYSRQGDAMAVDESTE
jgi:hypothetical protein